MERIFISSLVRGEMAAIRTATRAAVESLDMRPVMVETQSASAEGSRRALLDQVGTSDALLLLGGAEYGEPGERGISPTEEEFQQARDRGIDVLALVQEGVEREPAQQAFLRRGCGVPGSGALLTANFTGADDVALAAVKTLSAWQRGRAGSDAMPSAVERTLELAGTRASRRDVRRLEAAHRRHPGPEHAADRRRHASQPRTRLLGAAANAARASGLVSHEMGIQTAVEP